MSTADDQTRDDGGTQTVDLAHHRAKRMRQRLMLVVDRLLHAIEQRDAERVWMLLDDPEAYRCIPSNVREEALAMAQLPGTSLRAPVRLYRYQYLLRRLDDEPLTPDRQRDSVSRAQEQWRTGSGTPFVIADATDDRPLGLLNLQFGVEEEVAGVAVSVFPQARGRGVASKALRLGAMWGLRELRLCRVFAEAAVDNPASIRAIEKVRRREAGDPSEEEAARRVEVMA